MRQAAMRCAIEGEAHLRSLGWLFGLLLGALRRHDCGVGNGRSWI